MFTIKLCHQNFYKSLSAPAYLAQTYANGDRAIIVYKDFSEHEGIEYRVSKDAESGDSNSYEVCFVENQQGKTIDTIKPVTI